MNQSESENVASVPEPCTIQSDKSAGPQTSEEFQTERMLSVFLCPLVREEMEGRSYAPRLFGCIDRWQELGRPHLVIALTGKPVEEWLPELERFLDSL